MPDNFQSHAKGLESPATSSFLVTPSNSELPVIPRAVMVGSAGNITGQLLDDSTDTTISVVPGVIYALRYKIIKATSTAGNIVGLA